MEEFWETSPAYELLGRFEMPRREEAALSSMILDGRLYSYSTEGGAAQYVDDLFPGPDGDRFACWNRLAWNMLDEFESRAPSDRHGSRSRIETANFASFVSGLNLPRRLQAWIRVLVETECAIEWHRISVLDGLHEMRPFLLPRPSSRAPRSVRVRGGNIGLVDALVARIPPDGVRLGAHVTSVSAGATGAGVEVGYKTSAGRAIVVRGRHCIVTTPAWTLPALDIDPPLRAGARMALASIRFGTYLKVILRLRTEGIRIREHGGEHPFTLLSDGPAGCMYLTDGRPVDRDHVLTMLMHGRAARALVGRRPDHVVGRAIAALEQLEVTDGTCRHGTRTPILPGVRTSITSAHVIEHPRAVAYWPHSLGRSRFDALADDLRTPHGPILLGGDTTESSHSDGAVRSGQRMARVVAAEMNSRGG